MCAWLAADLAGLPADVSDRARLLMLDTVGCAIAGFRHRPVRDYAARLAQPGGIALPGLAALPPAHLGQVLAVSACWDEACEGLARAHGRPGLHAAPAALAAGLARRAAYGSVLAAIVAGYEVGGRLGEVLRIRTGMHVDGTWGTIAAAVAARAVEGFAAGDLMAALNAAACTLPASLYAPVREGATMRNLYAGQAVSRGYEVAQAVVSRVGVPAGGIDEAVPLSFIPDAARELAAPREWLILEGYFKPFAAVRHVHYGAQAALDWRKISGGQTDSITGLLLETYPEAVTYCGNRAPRAAIQAQFSLTYGLAHALVRGSLGPEAYDAAALADPETTRLEALVELDATGKFTDGRGARLTVRRGERNETTHVEQVCGDPAAPMSADGVKEKFLAYTAASLGTDRAATLAGRILDAAPETPVSEIFLR